MEKDKSPGLPPPVGRVPGLSSVGNAANTSFAKPETANSGQTADSNRFSHDISRMLDDPPKKLGHRRAHSEIIILPNDLNFSELGVMGATISESLATATPPTDPSAAASTGGGKGMWGEENVNTGVGSSMKPRARHQHSLSMDGSTSIKPEMFMPGSEEAWPAESKKAMSAAKLAELALVDPKRAKSSPSTPFLTLLFKASSSFPEQEYVANRINISLCSADSITDLMIHLTLPMVTHEQRDSTGLTAENSELKLRLQTMEQQIYLQDCERLLIYFI
ncbi:hypothetical protein V6N13_060547 [Hibiscus sabdariffa]|uniref:Uncharacterized protein n=1 Tax=Hibiscus sabdariffa TaxID=183260 RepID=A0ABR2P7U7_9ROSI